ncbi:MAG: hypothetical protein IPJ85_05420 [Flavobacteriales bacterium]|nr:hypothetical protein [Flavobacteriales bacterium]
MDRFAGRTMGVATIHGKERVIGPALLNVLRLRGVHPIAGIDTDRFGAFSGEVQRTLDPLEACKVKALHGVEVSGLDLVIASEGSFGPYPPAPFMSCNEEVLVLYDGRDERFFTHRHIALETVFGGEHCKSWLQVRAFAERMKFPEHGLVVRSKGKWATGDAMKKGITSEEVLRSMVDSLVGSNGSCWVETDMRAMMNPTRMRVIGETAARFANELATACPVCNACWFRVTGTRHGLPCALCSWPTESIRSIERGCWECGHVAFESRPDGKREEDPQHCSNCNP